MENNIDVKTASNYEINLLNDFLKDVDILEKRIIDIKKESNNLKNIITNDYLKSNIKMIKTLNTDLENIKILMKNLRTGLYINENINFIYENIEQKKYENNIQKNIIKLMFLASIMDN